MEKRIYTVYKAYTRQIAHESTSKRECKEWILAHAFRMPDGCRIFRTWESEGDVYIDTGEVFIFNEFND